MKMLSLILAVSLAVPNVLLAAESPFSRAKLTAAMAGEARDAAAASTSTAPTSWKKVVRLEVGTLVRVIADGQPDRLVHFVRADENEVVGLDLTGLPKRVVSFLVDVLGSAPAVFAPDSKHESQRGPLRVSRDGVFVSGEKVADIRERTVREPRGVVAEVSFAGHGTRKSQLRGGLTLIAIGAAVTLGTAYATCKCGEGAAFNPASILIFMGAGMASKADRMEPDGRTIIYRR